MSNNQLTGNIPPELGNLTDMQELSLYSNQLTGPIPPELGNLEKLVVLDLYSNNFTDSIPKELGNLTNLELLDIGRNNLTGHIPPTLGDLNNLEFLDLYYNQLTGSIPSKLGNLIKMETLYLGFNQLTGTIPAELGNLTNLEMLYLSYNQLTGTIPVEFGNLTSLKWCYFNNNQLEGAIPSEIGSIYSMQQLDIYNNNLDGLPDFSNLSEMTIFRIQNNYFSFGDLENTNINMEASQYYLYAPQKTNLPLAKDTTANTVKLSVLAESSTNNYQWIKDENLLSTQTDSTISYEVTDTGTYYCKITNDNFPDLTLQSIAIGKNMKNGVVRDDYDALVSIYTHTNGENWNNKDNWLTPEHVSNWHGVTVKGSRVVRLILSTNNLSGTIPTELAQLDSLNTLSIWDNKGITGSIPSELSKLKKLEYLRISNEKLTGTVPCELASLPRLKYLYLFENKLTGCIPSEFGDMTNMTTLYICYNQFEDLPDLSGLTNLRTCIIHDNKFNFMDLEEAKIDWSSLNNWAYWPQAKLPMPDTSLVKDQLTLEVIDHANDNNFFWYKDGSLIDSSSTPQITITVGPEGYYHCKITNDNYPHLTLETDSIKIIVAFNSVNFNVSDGSEPLPDAIISINQNDLTTDNEGMASIDLVNGTYNYNISLEGYQDTSGTFTLSNSDTTINIDLSVIASFTNNPVESNVRIYPNPTGDYIFVESDVEIQRIKVVNLKGQTIFSTKPEAKKWSLNTYQIKCNIGFIHILLKNGDYVTKKIIKP
jgi:Leucine-rich repeat (LRR) protein